MRHSFAYRLMTTLGQHLKLLLLLLLFFVSIVVCWAVHLVRLSSIITCEQKAKARGRNGASTTTTNCLACTAVSDAPRGQSWFWANSSIARCRPLNPQWPLSRFTCMCPDWIILGDIFARLLSAHIVEVATLYGRQATTRGLFRRKPLTTGWPGLIIMCGWSSWNGATNQ